MAKTLNDMFDDVILNNELSGNLAAAYRFSHAGGKSGYSFGRCQFDVKNNPSCHAILAKLGFSPDEIAALVAETVNASEWNSRLADGSEIIDAADTDQLSTCLLTAINFAGLHGIPLDSPGGILALADYANQYGAPGNESAAYYKALGRPVTPQDVLNFKLNHTAYGEAHPDDCKRRYAGVVAAIKKDWEP